MLSLTFVIGQERFTIPAASVVEVLPAVEFVPANQNTRSSAVLGLIRHRGYVVPLVDPTHQATVWEPKLSRRIIIIEARATEKDAPRRIGIPADRVLDLRTIDFAGPSYEPVTTQPTHSTAYADDEGIVQSLDVESLVRHVYVSMDDDGAHS